MLLGVITVFVSSGDAEEDLAESGGSKADMTELSLSSMKKSVVTADEPKAGNEFIFNSGSKILALNGGGGDFVIGEELIWNSPENMPPLLRVGERMVISSTKEDLLPFDQGARGSFLNRVGEEGAIESYLIIVRLISKCSSFVPRR